MSLKDLTEKTARKWLHERGVEIEDIAKLVYLLQEKYHKDLQMEDCIHNVERVLSKREVQNAVITGIQLDVLAEKSSWNLPCKKLSKQMKGFTG